MWLDLVRCGYQSQSLINTNLNIEIVLVTDSDQEPSNELLLMLYPTQYPPAAIANR